MLAAPNEYDLTGGGGGGIPGLGKINSSGGDSIAIQPFDPSTKDLTVGLMGPLATTNPISLNSFTDPAASGITIPGTTPVTTGTATSFPANTGGVSGIPGTTNDVTNLNVGNLLGFNSTDPSQLISQLDTMFGKGVGQVFYNFLSSGAGYNPQVASALQAANLPYEERTRNNILESFGASGGRYGSPAAIGLGDFESSYTLGQQKILADLYNTSVDRYSRMFSGILDTAHLEQANKLQWPDILNNIAKVLSSLGKPSGSGGSSGGGGGNIVDLIKGIFNKTPGAPNVLPGNFPINNMPGFGNIKLNPGAPPQDNVSSNIIFDSNNYDPGSMFNPDGSINWDNFLNSDPSQGGLGGFNDGGLADPNSWINTGANFDYGYGDNTSGGGGGDYPVDSSGSMDFSNWDWYSYSAEDYGGY